MEHTGLENWDAERYKELNTFFRIKIELVLKANPHLLQDKSLSLSDLVAQLNEEDQQRWQEFMQLDKLKLEYDMWRHLHGEGSGFKPGFGFNNPEDVTW